MEVAYPIVLYIGIPLIIILAIINIKKRNEYKEGKKIANTKYVKSIPYYNEVMKKYKTLKFLAEGVCIFSIVLSIILLARPVKIENSKSKTYSRDIFLCMDVSASVDSLNMQLVDELKQTVRSLKGERFGITIFNTSSVLLVPLTDDYEYIEDILDTIYKSLETYRPTGNISSDDYLYFKKYIVSGTDVGAETIGSSLIGDGLAACIYNFPNFEEERTRIIIMSTDNNLAGTPIVELQEAAQIAKENNITVFGIAPKTIKEKDRQGFEEAVKYTGGNFYVNDEDLTVSQIVKDIEKKEKSLMEVKEEKKVIDKPVMSFVLLVMSVIILFILNKKVGL